MKKKLISLVAVGFLASCGGGGGSSDTLNVDTTNQTNTDITTAQTTTPTNYTIPTISEADKSAFLDAINNARAVSRDCGDGKGVVASVGALTWNNDLYEASYEHNYDMLNANFFAHEGSATQYDISGAKLNKHSDPLDRVKNSGYLDTGVTSSYGAGENLADAHTTIQSAVNDWLNSPPHCANIMTSNFTEMGLSKVAKSNGGFLWTNVFGFKK